MDMYTLLYLKWITNKDLPYSTGNSVQYYVAVWMGGKFGEEQIYVYIRSSWLVLIELMEMVFHARVIPFSMIYVRKTISKTAPGYHLFVNLKRECLADQEHLRSLQFSFCMSR